MMHLQNFKKHPYSLFWVGVIIGAIVTGILFLYRIYGPDFRTAIFKTPVYKTQQQKKSNLKQKKSVPSFSSKKDFVNDSNPSPSP